MLPAAVYLYNTEAFDVEAAMHGTTAAVLQVIFVTATVRTLLFLGICVLSLIHI